MNKKLPLTYCLLLAAFFGHAQSYGWITGGGSINAMLPSENNERVTSMCTDENGNIYTTSIVGATSIMADTFYEALAHNTLGNNTHILLASYSCDGAMRWAKLIESSDYTYTDDFGESNGALAYSNGSIYLVGTFEDGYSSKYVGYDTAIYNSYWESFTARFDTSGLFKWIRFVGPDSPSTLVLTGYAGTVAIDGQGYIHYFDNMQAGVQLTPSVMSDTNGTYDLKYDSTGNLISAVRVHLDSFWTIAKVVFNKLDGNFYTILTPDASYYYTYYATSNTAVCAFRPDESIIWMDTTGQSGGILSLDYKGGNEIYACGEGNFYDTSSTFTLGGITVKDTIFPGYNIAVVYRLDTNGVAHWVYNLQSHEGLDMFSDITILPGGKIATAGQISGISIHGRDTIISTVNNPLFLIVDSSGNTVKLDQFLGTGGDDCMGIAITSDAVGNVYAGGMLDENMYASGLTPYVSHGGNTDFFILKYGYNCSCIAAPVASFTDTGTYHRGFTYTGTTTAIDSIVWSFGDGSGGVGTSPIHTYTASGTYRACATVYTSCGSDEYCQSITIGHVGINALSLAVVNIYPNPATDQLIIENAVEGTTIALFNIIGQQVYTGTITNSRQPINTHSLPNGNYIIQLTDANGNRMNKTVVKE